MLRKETSIPPVHLDTFSTANKALLVAECSLPAWAISKKQDSPLPHRVNLGQHLSNDHNYFYLGRSTQSVPPCRNVFALGLPRSLLQILKEDMGSMAMFLSTRPWERMGLDFQKSRCCFWDLGEEEIKSETGSIPRRSLLQRKVGQDRERRYNWSCFPSYSQHGPSACIWSGVWCCKEKFQTHYSLMLESVDLIL